MKPQWKISKLRACINGVNFTLTNCTWRELPWNLEWTDGLGKRSECFHRLKDAKARAERFAARPKAKGTQ